MTRDEQVAALDTALTAVLEDFDREPPADYLPEARRIFLTALDTAGWTLAPTAALDVERLERAIRAAARRYASSPGVDWPEEVTPQAEWAERIAAEYAAERLGEALG